MFDAVPDSVSLCSGMIEKAKDLEWLHVIAAIWCSRDGCIFVYFIGDLLIFFSNTVSFLAAGGTAFRIGPRLKPTNNECRLNGSL
jgi:hypothetical protein